MIRALCNYYDTYAQQNAESDDIIRPGYMRADVQAEIVIDADGNIVGVNALKEIMSAGKAKKEVPKKLVVPFALPRGGKRPAPYVLRENAGFIFGANSKPESAEYRFNATRSKHEEVFGQCDDDGAKALLKFFAVRPKCETLPDESRGLGELEENTYCVFRLATDTCYIHERPAIQKAWDAYYEAHDNDGEKGQCLVTGEIQTLAIYHSGISGYGMNKPMLTSFNKESFCSYGMKAGENAPMAKSVVFKYGTAMNLLVKDRDRCLNIAHVKVIFWSEGMKSTKNEKVLKYLLTPMRFRDAEDPFNEEMQALLEYGVYSEGMDPDNEMHMIITEANMSRLIIKHYFKMTFGEIVGKVGAFMQTLQMGDESRYPSPADILVETLLPQRGIRSESKIPDGYESSLINAVITDATLPPAIAQQVQKAMCLTSRLTNLGVGILRSNLTTKRKECITMALDETRKDPAYLVGRMLAVMDVARESGKKREVNSVSQNLFMTLTMPRAYMAKSLIAHEANMYGLKKYNPGKANRLARIMEEIMHDMPAEYPKVFTTDERSLAMIGYYQQRKSIYEYMKNGEQNEQEEN